MVAKGKECDLYCLSRMSVSNQRENRGMHSENQPGCLIPSVDAIEGNYGACGPCKMSVWGPSFMPGTASLIEEIFLFCLNVYLFLRERERESTSMSWRGAGRGGQRIQSGLCADSTEPDAGLELMNCEIVT